ncbi:MAG TPA: TonB-dependent receptor [Vicinamibacterales bacterium]|nr:TonB-dependent receptor [Vicinamibacterales bacterium]
MRLLRPCSILYVVVLSLVTPPVAHAQTGQQPPHVTLPSVTVTAQKEPADPQNLPVSLTTIPLDALWNGGLTTIGEASIYAPNTYFTDFTARKLSNPRFRGIGSSPANPAISTYIDGVPQLNTNSSSIELLDVGQLEFVRGPQSALFGRNTLGGLVNITSVRPSLTRWTGSAIVPFGNFSAVDVRANASGPIGSKAALGFAIGHAKRDGFTTNDLTGHDVDFRNATFGKAQLLLTPTPNWEARLIYTGERARDGDYALNDLGSLRQRPFHTARDFEGHTNRDVNATTFLARHEGKRLTFASTTGYVRWKTDDLTDLDYTPLPLLTRANAEKDAQFTEEVRFASAPAGAVKISDAASLKWQAGLFLFSQNYDQDAVNNFAPFVLSASIPVSVSQHSPQASLDDTGVGIYGNGTLAVREKLNVTFGARFDHENRKADLKTFYSPAIAPPTVVNTEKAFSNASPQAAVSYRVHPDALAYVSVTGGFKAGGFNPASPAGQEAYSEEHTWNVEGGLKTAWFGRRVTANASVFSIDWQDLQLNLPNPAVPGQFYIANVGGARSSGVEFELNGRPRDGVDVFAAFGYTHARFAAGTTSSGVNVSDKKIPDMPDYTATFGAQVSHPIRHGIRVYGRAEAVFYGALQYDDANTAGQDAYSLTNLRAGARGKCVFVEAWIRNAFDTKYIPVAFAYGQLAPSGFVGEMGRPRTFGMTAGVSF